MYRSRRLQNPSDDNINQINKFIVAESATLEERFWELLPFNITAMPRGSLSSATGNWVLGFFKRGYAIACLFHGAPADVSPESPRIARRQLRENGAPYIIH